MKVIAKWAGFLLVVLAVAVLAAVGFWIDFQWIQWTVKQ